MENMERSNGRSLRGFASMDREKQKSIASKGGRAAHEKVSAGKNKPPFDQRHASSKDA